MCVIIHFPAGSMIDFPRLKVAVHNNWHSYGLVTRIDGKLDIKKVIPKNGEVDPQEVYDLLQKDEEFERILHLRHNTAGATNLKNCHPFDVYYDEHRQVVFMHNGTFSDYKPKKFDKDGKLEDDPSGPSDSITFAEENITPMLVRSGGNIEDQFFRRVTTKFWAGSNRGILISSDQTPWFIGEWKEITHDGVTLKVSNNDYFDRVQRGPEHDRRLEIAKAAREAEELLKKNNKHNKKERPFRIGQPDERHIEVNEQGAFFKGNSRMSTSYTGPTSSVFSSKVTLPVAPLKDFDFTQPSLSQLSESPVNICNDWDVYDREHLVSLACLNKEEWEQMYSDKTTMIFVADYLSSDYGAVYAELMEAEDKIHRQEKVIEEMANKLKGVK